MKKGHAVSVLTERVAEGSWQLPLENQLVPVGSSPTAFGASQVVAFVQRYGWEADDLLEVDAAYTNQPTLRPMVEEGVNVLGRVSSKRVFYLPAPPYSGHGRPRVRGKKIKLNDARTLPEPEATETVSCPDGRCFEVAQWADVRMRKWPEQSLVLYRIIEYRADGTRRYERPLWVIYISKEHPAPSLREGATLYPHRFGVEHSLRFEKGDVGMVCGQFNGPGTEGRVQLWVELVATAMWQLFAARPLVQTSEVRWPAWLRYGKLTPGTIRRLAMGVLLQLGIQPPEPQPRGKSPGRSLGRRFEPRPRYRVYRKRAPRTVAAKK